MVKLLKRAPPATKVLKSSHELLIELSSNEGPAESRSIVAQMLWGDGNQAPSDTIFASTAIMALIVNAASAFAVVGPRSSGRLTKLSLEANVWVDAFETEPVRFTQDHRKGAKIKRAVWSNGKGMLPKGKFTAIYLAQPSYVSSSLDGLYGEAATALRSSGKVFSADFILRPSKNGKFQTIDCGVPGSVRWQSRDAHMAAFTKAQLRVLQEFDMGRELMIAIRDGLIKSMGKLPDIRALEQPWKRQRLAGFLAELEAWFVLYRLMETDQIAARGYLAERA